MDIPLSLSSSFSVFLNTGWTLPPSCRKDSEDLVPENFTTNYPTLNISFLLRFTLWCKMIILGGGWERSSARKILLIEAVLGKVKMLKFCEISTFLQNSPLCVCEPSNSIYLEHFSVWAFSVKCHVDDVAPKTFRGKRVPIFSWENYKSYQVNVFRPSENPLTCSWARLWARTLFSIPSK